MQQSLAALIVHRARESKDSPAVLFKEGRGPYQGWTWSELWQFVEELSFGLMALGLSTGEKAGLIANTSHLWVAADLSILCAGGVSVPIYPTSSQHDAEHILNNGECKLLFVHTEALLHKILSLREHLPKLEKIILLTPPVKGKSVNTIAKENHLPADYLIGVDELRKLGESFKKERPDEMTERIDGIKYDDLATIIYTSGTTGTPKGVMLLNSTILSVIRDLPGIIPITGGDTYLSFLPLSHVFERVCGEFYWIQNGSQMAFAEGLEHIAKNIHEVKPNLMLVVPRLLDKIYAKVMSGIQGASPKRQKLINWALDAGKEACRERMRGRPIRLGLQAKLFVAERLVYRKLRERIGSFIRMIVSGGAPATAEVLEFFNAIGMNVIEGYGLTETAAPTNVNRTGRNKIGTVGPALPSVQVRIAEDGEILFKGPTVFKGYYKAPDMTAEVFSDGWFHSGDIGEIDRDGCLRITDRKKDLIVNSAGKNIAPQKIEAVLKTVPFVSQAVVFGDKRKTLVALLTLEEQAVIEFAREKGWNFNEYEDLAPLPQLKKYLKVEIANRSYHLADYEQVRNITVLPRELTIESGELTATMKVKRNVLAQKYREQIESLYTEDTALARR